MLDQIIRRLSPLVHIKNCSSWSDEFCRKETAAILVSIQRIIKGNVGEITDLPSEDLLNLAFTKWEEDSELLLIPLLLKDLIPKDFEVTCIDGTKCKVEDADDDIRFGCVAYGFIPKDKI